MCGRLNIHNPAKIRDRLEAMGITTYLQHFPRYNVCPGTFVHVVHDGQVTPMEWGIAFGQFRHPNTKVETLRRKPFLQALLRAQRGIVPVNRFYEWPDPKTHPKYAGIKIRYCIHPPDDVLYLGAIWKISPDGVPQFNVLTTDPCLAISGFHHRMPVIVPESGFSAWFGAEGIEELDGMLAPFEGQLRIYPCSAYVDNGRHEGPECMAPLNPDAVGSSVAGETGTHGTHNQEH